MGLRFDKPEKQPPNKVELPPKVELIHTPKREMVKLNKEFEKKEEEKSIARAKPMKDLQDSLRNEDAVKLITIAYNHNPRNYLILLTLLLTGRRISEVLELKQRHIDFRNKMILWNIKKKRDKNYQKFKPAPFILIDNLKEFIRIKNIAPDDYVFYGSRKGRTAPISRQAVFLFLKKYGKEIGLDVHPHTFRHTFAIWMVRRMKHPGGLIMLKDALEHSDLKITEHYLQFSQKETADLQEEITKNIRDEYEEEEKDLTF